MSKAKTLLVPVSLARGGVMHDTDYARGAEDIMHAAQIDNECFDKTGHMRWGADYIMQEVAPFPAVLRVVSADSKGSYVILVDDAGHQYPMFITDYVAMMRMATVGGGWIEMTTYETCKKGARAYGIRPVKS